MSNIAGFADGVSIDGLAIVEDLYGLPRVCACLKPGEHHPGPCPGTGKSLISKLFPRPRAKAKTSVPAAVVGHQRARGADIVADLDMDTIGRLPKRDSGGARWRSGNRDLQLAAIAARQGFDGPPNLVDQEEFDRLKSRNGAVALFRGLEDNYDANLSGDEIAALFRTGPVHYGQGWAGNGVYAAGDREGALKYTTGNRASSLNEMVLDPGARTINIADLRAQMDRDIPDDVRARLDKVAAAQQMAFTPGQHAGQMITEAQAMKKQLQPQDWLWMDPSAYAMARGYDAIYHGKVQRFPAGEWVLLNRTAMHTLVPKNPPRTLDELYPERVTRTAVAAGARLEACLPPHVPVPKPGPCPGSTRGVIKTIRKGVRKSVVQPKTSSRTSSRPDVPAGTTALAAPVKGRDVTGELDYIALGDLPVPMFSPNGADQKLTQIARVQGFDGLPQVVTREQMDALVSEGNRELWRGVQRSDRSPAEIQEQLRSGSFHIGVGSFGNGLYFSPHRETARKYSGGEAGMVRAVLHPDARVISLQELEDQVLPASDAVAGRETAQKELLDSIAAQPDTRRRAIWAYYMDEVSRLNTAQAHRDLILSDTSNRAMANGYDAIILNGPAARSGKGPAEEQIILLNRTALVIEEAQSRAARKRAAPAAPPVTASLVPAATQGTGGGQVTLCLPPHVPVPKPGPCPGKSPGAIAKKTARKAAGGAVKKATAAPKSAPKRRSGGKNRPGRIAGQDLTGQLDYATIGAEPVGYKADRADRQMAAIAHAQGFDGLPSTGTAEQLDALKAAGGIELFRGVSHARDYDTNRIKKRAASLVKEFKDGDAYYGVGDFGSGIYFSEDPSDMERYAEDGPSGMVRAVLSPDARIADYEVAREGAEREGNSVERAARQRQMFNDLAGKPMPEKRAIRRAYHQWLEERPDRENVLGDMGRWAAANGYDAIRVTDTFPTGHTYVAVLNRTALTTLDGNSAKEPVAQV